MGLTFFHRLKTSRLLDSLLFLARSDGRMPLGTLHLLVESIKISPSVAIVSYLPNVRWLHWLNGLDRSVTFVE